MTRRIHSFVWGGLALAGCLVAGFVTSYVLAFAVIGILAFALISCLILDNNFVGDLLEEIFGWSFVTLPGLIFELDLDGILWFLTVKLLFWLLGFVLAIIFGILAIICGMVVSIFVYPFALYKNFKGKE